MTRFDRSDRESKNQFAAHFSLHNLNSLVHDQEASRHCMLSDTHHKSLDLIFAAPDNQNLHRSLCKRTVRDNQGDKGMHLRTAPIGQTSPRGPQDLIHLHRQTKREVMVRKESKKHDDTDEIHVGYSESWKAGQETLVFNDAFIHVTIGHGRAAPFTTHILSAQPQTSLQDNCLYNGFSNTSTSAESASYIYLRREQGV